MGCIIHYLLALEFLLLLLFMAQARQISKLSETSMDQSLQDEEQMVMMRGVIGSKPPRCDIYQRCKACDGHCEAVQVPIVATKKKEFIIKNQLFNFPGINSYYRGDYVSNYKPMCWKCRCGDFFFNP